MNKLFWFNPENDLALAAGSGNYTPPAAAVALRQGGVRLPELWADSTDCIFDADTIPQNISNPAVLDPEPWGWSVYARNRLLKAGMPSQVMPDDDGLARMRSLSHRRTSVNLLRELGKDSTELPVEAFTLADALKAIESVGGDAVVKLPWSCSGRGVFYSRVMKPEQIRSVIKGGISRQGSVMIERRLDRLEDFAMLFRGDGTQVAYRGLSLFTTDCSGNYSGNLVAPRCELAERLAIDDIQLGERIGLALGKILGEGYTGWVGVDMMKYRCSDGRIAVHPCVEVNLRMTMGVAALLASERGRLPWDKALLRVSLPGEILGNDVITLSASEPDCSSPLKKPVVTVNNAERRG